MAGAAVNTDSRGAAVKTQVLLVLCACLGALNFGYTTGFSAPAIQSLVRDKQLSEWHIGWFGSLMTVGALLGGPLSGWCIDRHGRKRTILFSSFPFLLGYASMIVKHTPLVMFAGRFLTGLGSGMVSVCVPMYIAEIASSCRRGVLGSCCEICIVVGIFLAFLVGLTRDWIRMAYVALLPAAMASMGACLLPESPRWLLTQYRKREAAEVLSSIRDVSEGVEEELWEMEEGIRCQPSVSWSELTSKEELRRPLLLSVTLFLFQQLSGISAVMYYTVSIFSTLIPQHAYPATAIVGLVKMLVTILVCLQLDRAGRKVMVKVGGTLMGVSLFLFGMCYRLVEEESTAFATATSTTISGVPLRTWLPILCLTSANVGFAVGWGAVPFLFMSEVFPTQAQGKAGGVAMLIHWLAAFVVTKAFHALQLLLGHAGVFYLFGLCSFLGVSFVCKYLPETKGMSLEAIQQYFLLHSSGRI